MMTEPTLKELMETPCDWTQYSCECIVGMAADRIEELEAELRNAEGYLWDASDASQWEDYINGVPHLKSEYTKENDDDA